MSTIIPQQWIEDEEFEVCDDGTITDIVAEEPEQIIEEE